MENDNTPRTTATSASEGRLKDSLSSRRRDIINRRRHPFSTFKKELKKSNYK